jgi:hypothetical protein
MIGLTVYFTKIAFPISKPERRRSMRITCQRKLPIRATLFLSFLFVFVLGSKTYAATEAKLLASDGAAYDYFGYVASISSDVALLGADSNDDNGVDSGSAYVFRRNGSNWVEEQKLLPSDGAAYDYFGTSVSISGNVALVGADGNDDNGVDSGSAYVFRWNGSNWVQEQKLLPSDGAAYDYFGWEVSINGDVALVGAVGDGDNGDESGSAYVFRWNGSNWVQEQKLLPSGGAAYDWFGESVSISGNVALIGADGNDDKGDDSGSAYVFRWNGSNWVQEQKLLPSDGAAFDYFGYSLSIDGNVALVGADSNDDNGVDSGSAYVFRWNGSNWVQEQKLLPSDGAAFDYFGYSLSIDGNVVLVGAVEDGDNGDESGSAYVFRWNGSNWVQEQKLLPSDGAAYDWFGESVSISGNVALIGANGNDDKGDDSGSAYVYTLEAQFVADFSAIPTSGPAPLIVSFSDQSTGTVSSWNWNFGDGTISNKQNPSHTYTDPGTYTVSLTVTCPGGSDTETKADYIKVRSPSKAMPWIPLLLLDD